MAKRILAGTYADGYTLQPRFSKLQITDSAVIEGYGLVVSAQASVSNRGSIIVSPGGSPGYNGVTLEDGGQISNGGTIVGGFGYSRNRRPPGDGGTGIEFDAGGSVVNSGFIAGGHGGSNGFRSEFGGAVGGAGINLTKGGSVLNKAGTIVGGVGGDGGTPVYYPQEPGGAGGAGVKATGSVEIINDALIEGGEAGYGGYERGTATGGAGVAIVLGSIVNAGTLMGGEGGYGYERGEGHYGGNGVAASAAATIVNSGAVLGGVGGGGGFGGLGGVGIYLAAAGSISNGRGEIIGGAGGTGGYANNYGSRGGDGGLGGAGIVLEDGGSIQNLKGDIVGGAGGYGYFVDGFGGAGGVGGVGIEIHAGGTLDNLGTVAGGLGAAGSGGAPSGANGDGILLADGGVVLNGSHKSLIDGAVAVSASAAGSVTVINYGTIEGTGGVAVQFASANDRLDARAQSDFIGLVEGGGGTLEITGGTGSITGIGGSGVATGSMTLRFTGFGAYVFDGTDAWTMTGTNSLASGQSLTDASSLTIGGTLVNAGTVIAATGGTLTVETAVANTGTLLAEGTLIVESAVTGAGVAKIDAGTLSFLSTFDEAVSFVGLGTLALSDSQDYSGQITGFSATGGADLDLGDIGFVGADEATFSGTGTGGVLTVTDGTHNANINLVGDYLDSTFVASSDGKGGVDIVATSAQAPSVAHFAGVMAALTGHGAAAGLIDVHTLNDGRQMLLATPRLALA